MNERAQDDWDDRALDAALHELHGSKPPDLSARVLGALHESPPGPLPMLAPRARASVSALAAVLLGAAAVGFVAASACWLLARPEPSSAQDGAAVLLDVDVQRGVLAGHALRSPAGEPLSPPSLDTGARGAFVARNGNRMRSDGACSFRLGTFGSLSAPARMELEVQSMELTTKHGVLAASSLTLAVVAGVVTWHTLSRTETAAAGEVLRMQAASDGGSAAALTAENAGLKQRVGELERQVEKLHAQILEREAAPAVPAPVAATEPEPPPAAKPGTAFDDPKFAELLSAIDWQTMGAVTNEMSPLLVELVEEMEKTGTVSNELGVKLQALNTKLLTSLPAMMKSGLPGFGANGTYTHPLIAANTLAATLTAAGQPMNDSQRAAIGGLVRTFSVENQSIADASHEFDLEGLAAEVDMKDRFYKEVSTLLTPDQYSAMYPEGARAYDGVSLFSTGLMTRPYTEGVPASNAGDFARLASNKLGEELELDEATSAKVRGVVERMAANAPELWQNPANKTEATLKMLKAGRTSAALRRQIEVMREIQRSVPLTPDQQKKLRKLKGVLVPLPR